MLKFDLDSVELSNHYSLIGKCSPFEGLAPAAYVESASCDWPDEN